MINFHIIKITLKNGDVRYRSIITRSGKAIKTKTFRRKTDARTWASRLVLDYQENEAKGMTLCTITFSQCCKSYMENWKGKDHDRGRLVSLWNDQLGKIILSEVTTELIREILRKKKDKAPATYNKYKTTISSIFEYEISREGGSIKHNPCKEIKSLPVDNKRVRFLSSEEKPRLLKEAKNIGGKFYLKVLMALTTGMRKGEIEKLRWNDIDFERGLAILHDTKNGTARHTPIPNVIMGEVKKYREVGNTLLFPSTVNPNKTFDYTKQWLRCLKNANIQNFRWHDMRHDTASTLARDGKTLKEIAEVLGHKSLESTNRYAHLSTEHKARVLNDTMNKSISL